MNKDERLIQIPLEEYKELLIIKGRYEELNQKITYVNGVPVQEYIKELKPPYKITCDLENKGED